MVQTRQEAIYFQARPGVYLEMNGKMQISAKLTFTSRKACVNPGKIFSFMFICIPTLHLLLRERGQRDDFCHAFKILQFFRDKVGKMIAEIEF